MATDSDPLAGSAAVSRRIRGRTLFLYMGLSVLALAPWLAVVIAVATLVDSAPSGEAPSPAADAVSRLGAAASIFVLYGVLLALLLRALKRRRQTLKDLLGPHPTREQVFWAAVAGTGLTALAMASFYALYVPMSYVAPGGVRLVVKDFALLGSRLSQDLPIMLMGAISAVVMAPLVEELFFRGLLLPSWAQKWNVRTAVVVSSLAFALLHFDWIGKFVFAVFVAQVFLRTGGLWLPILVHAAAGASSYLGWLAQDLVLGAPVNSVEALRESAWLGIPFFLVSVPLLAYAIWRFPSSMPRARLSDEAT